jgi:hypothetical protein
LLALFLSLIPISPLARAGVIAAGVFGAYVFAFVHGEYGLDRLGWIIVITFGVIGWCVGFVPAALFRAGQRFANRNAKPS